MAVDERFEAAVARHRGELLVACYQLLGSFHDAEDVVQETVVRAWRAWDRYDPARASVRTWLHRIATNVCLTALAGRARRPLPSTLVEAGTDAEQPLVPALDVPWLRPAPTTAFATGAAEDPAVLLVRAGAVRLAFAAALQQLPPRQRAAVVLIDVFAFSGAEAADVLGVSVAACHSLLQRGRRRLATPAAVDAPVTADEDVVDRYTVAFERGDVDAIVRLLAADAVLEMPPVPLWFRGRPAYGAFMARVYRLRGTQWATRRVSANGQPAFAAYVLDGDGYRFHTLQVLGIADGLVTANVVFQDPSLPADFGLPTTLPA